MATLSLPALPAKHQDLPRWIEEHAETPIDQLVAPYNDFEATVRKIFAQEPSHPALQDNHLNIVPLYGSDGSVEIKTRARDISSELVELREKYIMQLKDADRRHNGSPAVVPTVAEFRNNFNIFSEGSLSDMDWSNVAVAGSAVVTCLMPVPEQYRGSKRALRQFYHDKFAPASDVDLFLYGLTEEQAIEKIKKIEDVIKNAILYETTTIRTKNAITIVSQYPTRHVQIVLRIYKSISEVLTGFDVDCSCAAFDGKQVYVSPRALASYITQRNTIDLTRRSPSYENRLSKYSHRGFEIYWPQLERSRIDPTIFERSFSRTVGLGRLLVFEQLPRAVDREQYLEQRRRERGRPTKNAYAMNTGRLSGNIKDDWEDEVPDWVEDAEESNYNTFTVPYGPKYHARRIERLFYTKDLLLNAEWNKPKDRDVNLHRHPAFFGDVKDVIHDCCGFCPTPVTPEEKEIAEKESKIYISGDITFIKDDPGRQEIGSFNPITETDWTEMAYVGNTERLCQAIVDHDVEIVKEWLSQEGADPNTRDYTGRTPLHLACMASTPEIVQSLVDHGARLTARVADGRTALHLAAARGAVEIVTILLNRSERNEAEEDEKEQLRKASALEKNNEDKGKSTKTKDDMSESSESSDSEDDTSYTLGSFVKVEKNGQEDTTKDDILDDENTDEPDVYDINVVSWDTQTSALHLAILNGHVDVVQELVGSWGADVLLPVKLLDEWQNRPRASVLTLVLALRLPLEKATEMAEKLLKLGASPTQADLSHNTPLQYMSVSSHIELLDTFMEQNQPATQKAMNHLVISGGSWNTGASSALTIAIQSRNVIGVLKLLERGADPVIEFTHFIKSAQNACENIKNNPTGRNRNLFYKVSQPILSAVRNELPELVMELLRRGVDPNTLTGDGCIYRDSSEPWTLRGSGSLLDIVEDKIKELGSFKGELVPRAPPPFKADDHYFDGLEEGTYRMWNAKHHLQSAKRKHRARVQHYEKRLEELRQTDTVVQAKLNAMLELRREFEKLKASLLEKGAKTFKELYPNPDPPKEKPSEPQVRATEISARKRLMPSFLFLIPDMTDTKKEGYLKLFDAAWRGDLRSIKDLTLATWGESGLESPLRMAVEDSDELSPFAIAIFHGNFGLAKAILDIVQAQYKRKESTSYERFEMEDEDDEDSQDEEDRDDRIRIYSKIVDDKFTIEDISTGALSVESDISPLKVLQSTCPAHLFLDVSKRADRKPRDLFEYAVLAEDVDLLNFLLDVGQELNPTYGSDGKSGIYRVSNQTFNLAIENNRLRALEILIKRSGAELPFEAILQKSGLDKDEKPEYYQGLSVYGKKRKDWATANSPYATSYELNAPPLLYSAYHGKLDSTEWFLGTAPGRYYVEFAKANEGNKKLQLLAKSKDGIEKPLLSWVKSGNHLVLHCAILSKPTDESRRLIHYLIENAPESLEKKNAQGHTPLALAFSLHRVAFAEILIAAGANQTVRDGRGNNLLHLLLCDINNEFRETPKHVQNLLGLFDSRLVPSLLTERAKGSLTPISRWLSIAASNTNMYGTSRVYGGNNFKRESANFIEVAGYLLEFAKSTGQKHLELLDGAGNSPVHDVVKKQLPGVLELMLDQRPDLLVRENATGSTPLELAVDAWIQEVTQNPPYIPQDGYTSMRNQPYDDFSADRVAKKTDKTATQVIYDLCRARSAARPSKRKLVTLNEANEVAKRLAARKGADFTVYGLTTTSEVENQVIMWYQQAQRD
ncbi:Ankyrin repeat domain-containing protein 60 [Aspergillus nanangensis]|uniref:Ankyrin repeat domain-containing protein 60 n=1 Tax=Aspergillus nanangensis TaxID=2582783 RepID=A0AAD4CYL0_ASPNN|nr:Ankyrin repeat domain-containing protein 60 [Aspergillus nanangensis]